MSQSRPRFRLSLVVILAAGLALTGLVSGAVSAGALIPAERGAAAASQSARAKDVPSQDQWVADVKAAMKGSGAWLRKRVAAEAKREQPRKLAFNLDIDNSALASYYDFGQPTPYVFRLSKRAHRLGVALLFNTARVGSQLQGARALLTDAGYPVTRICGRRSTKTSVVAGKQACRAAFRAKGYVLIANIGNRPTDFAGGGFQRAFRLPNYGMRLG